MYTGKCRYTDSKQFSSVQQAELHIIFAIKLPQTEDYHGTLKHSFLIHFQFKSRMQALLKVGLINMQVICLPVPR